LKQPHHTLPMLKFSPSYPQVSASMLLDLHRARANVSFTVSRSLRVPNSPPKWSIAHTYLD
jgi:hypothetical protein